MKHNFCILVSILLLSAADVLSAVGVNVDPRIEAVLNQSIEKFDTNKSKVLEQYEQRRLVAFTAKEYGAGPSIAVEYILRNADADSDGSITYPEWMAYHGRIQSARIEPAVHSTVMLRMKDGVELATDLHIPAGEWKKPVVLGRTPYGRRNDGEQFNRRGMVLVMQDSRGRFDSAGKNFPFVGCGWHTYSDGRETVDWILKQNWCNGKVGTFGGSALGITQMLTAPVQPAVTAQYIEVAAACLYRHASYVGGAFRKSQVERWINDNKFDPEALAEMRSHPSFDEYWERYDSISRAADVKSPGLHVGGWFDTFGQGTIDGFTSRQYHGGEGARGRQKLVMGPWVHGLDRESSVGEMMFPNAKRPALYSPEAWFDYWLFGAMNGVGDTPAVAYYVMGDLEDPSAPGNEWKYSDRWPIETDEGILFLNKDGNLSKSVPAKDDSDVVIKFDPATPCPTKGGCNLCIPAGPFDQSEIEKRPDVLVFSTEPLREPVEITGQVKAVLHVASTAQDTDISVRMTDVYPDGRSYLMAEGMLRLRYMKSFRKPERLEPGKMYEVTIDCWSTSIVFNRGHRIRIAITSSNYPRFDINPGTGEVWTDGCRYVVQENRVFCNAKYPSHVILPVNSRVLK